MVLGRAEFDEGVAAGPLPLSVAAEEGQLSSFVRSAARDQFRRLAIALVMSDIGCLVTALLVARWIRFGDLTMTFAYLGLIVVAPLAWVLIFNAFALYRPHHLAPEEEFRRVLSAVSIGTIFLAVSSFWTKSSFSRIWIAAAWLIAMMLELAVRRAWRAWAAREREKGRLLLRTLVVGENEDVARLSQELQAARAGFHPVGYAVRDPESIAMLDELPVLASLADLNGTLSAHSIDCLFVSQVGLHENEMATLIQCARQAGIEMRVSATIPEILTSRLSLQPVGGIMTLSLRPPGLTRTQTVIKRGFDIILGGMGFLMALPLMATIAIAVRVGSPGPILFTQERVTKGGRSFRMLKFRTMVQDADDILRLDGIDASRPFFKMGEDDPRVTHVGRVLRRWSLDELPQLINVLRGEMSLVGPRPLPADQVAANMELLTARHEVPAGVTGWWQVRGRSALDSTEAVRMDIFYVENWSLTLDFYVLLKTIGAVLGRRGAV